MRVPDLGSTHGGDRLRGQSRARTAAVAIALALCIWGLVSSVLAIVGVYDGARFLSSLPGLWLPAVPILLVGILVFVLPFIRSGVHDMARTAPAHWLVGIQTLRLAAIGTLIKTINGEFPLHVELAIGLTDIAFGLSATLLYPFARSGRISADALAVWHMTGVLLIVIPGEIAIQTGLPGRLHVFATPPTSEVMLDFPIVLAPSLVVPVFLLLNILGVYAARTQSRERGTSHLAQELTWLEN